MQHSFHMQLQWNGGRNDVGTLQADRLKTKISIPPEMDGPGVGTNPDEMLLGAAATCYIITLAAMLERANISATLHLDSEGVVDVTNGVFTYESIQHNVTIRLGKDHQNEKQRANRLAVKAEETCMISKALKGNVNIQLNIKFE